MKKLILTAVITLSVSIALAAPDMPRDENGWRCEGDCDRDTKCEFCNPTKKRAKKAKKIKKSKRGVKKNKKQSGARKRPRRAKTTAVNEG